MASIGMFFESIWFTKMYPYGTVSPRWAHWCQLCDSGGKMRLYVLSGKEFELSWEDHPRMLEEVTLLTRDLQPTMRSVAL